MNQSKKAGCLAVLLPLIAFALGMLFAWMIPTK